MNVNFSCIRAWWLSGMAISLCTLWVALPGMAKDLPLLPEQESHPFADAKHMSLKGANALGSWLDELEYTLAAVRLGEAVPPVYALNLPKDLAAAPLKAKNSDFIRLLLPSILAVNTQIAAVRSRLEALVAVPLENRTEAELTWLAELSAHYRLGDQAKDKALEQLLLQLDVIPVGMMLAQGIDESGWGTSHFAVAGNALYGEHNPKGHKHYLTTPGGHVKVAAFNSLFEGTAAYVYNLNTAKAYQSMWEARRAFKAQRRLTGHQLVGELDRYSTRGKNYVRDLRNLISHHQLDAYDRAVLGSKQATVLRFER
ncbi:MAG: glucosaminidase domain-containing protein [Shewanella sp.]|nr:glucosaminidase domain-containing protein [Shewanella sp.]MCF1431734.1 glucosaminidase domain-containing protein [Shewanella sp.]MCF1438736.1 glucosaminidase domain-containing protein [Shewanella sp.]MCF1458533.1 glucosaminidase domain-containing protein [Shewanella sp.]